MSSCSNQSDDGKVNLGASSHDGVEGLVCEFRPVARLAARLRSPPPRRTRPRQPSAVACCTMCISAPWKCRAVAPWSKRWLPEQRLPQESEALLVTPPPLPFRPGHHRDLPHQPLLNLLSRAFLRAVSYFTTRQAPPDGCRKYGKSPKNTPQQSTPSTLRQNPA